MATHDVELVANCADRVILLGDGQVVVDGPARQVMSESLVFASQINKLFRDPAFLTVQDALSLLQPTGDGAQPIDRLPREVGLN
jgi:energy-coupling factor transport system ATP-binding protein